LRFGHYIQFETRCDSHMNERSRTKTAVWTSASLLALCLAFLVPQAASAEDAPADETPSTATAPASPTDTSTPGDAPAVEGEEQAESQESGAAAAATPIDPDEHTSADIAAMPVCPAGERPAAPDLFNGPDVYADVDGGASYTPDALGSWSNIPDMQKYGYYDPAGRLPWSFATGMARIICGAAQDSEIKISMYFVRALVIDASAPETDANAIWDALEWVHQKRNVKVSMVLEGQNSCVVAADGQSCSSPGSGSADSDLSDVRQRVADRFARIGKVSYCINGCFNTARFGTYFYGIEHEKFVTISDTVWPNSTPGTGPNPSQHPIVISSSGNWARSQIHSYVQDALYFYDDYKLYNEFSQRWDAMASCANDKCAIPNNQTGAYSALHLSQEPGRSIWASNMVRRPTDAGKGTEVIFSPQRSSDVNAYVSQLDAVDCKVDSNVRVAMFNMTDGLAQTMANRLKALKSAGCKVDVLLSLPGGGRGLSSSVISTLNGAKIPYVCTARSMHTKLILIGPDQGAGSILEGTQNLSVSGQLYSDEHIVSIKTQNVNKPGYRLDVAAAYAQYLTMFKQLKAMKGDNGVGASKALCG
jgi:hypothetical protein